ncbi:MAG: acyl-ACP--UDP-N-acetylglucosamine O-acyltransferase [Acidobacteriota bacterium]|nr:acyl-ACP--UDP-N-acetylglucosamine O-acyltransferase [Acidobacteriota bacterium]
MSTPAGIDPRAAVDPSARVGEDVFIGPFCVVGPDVEIGNGCRLESNVVVTGPTVMGEENVLHPMAIVGGPPQDLKYRGGATRLTIGSRNKIREGVTIHRGTEDGGDVTVVGDDNLLMAQVHVAHDCRVGSGIIFGNGATLAGHVEVGDGATVGAYSGIHQFCRVAREAFVGGYSVVTQDALPWVITVGNRAKSHGVNLVGLKRKGYAPEVVGAIKRTYMTLFRSKLGLEEAIAQVESELGRYDEVKYFVEFVRSSERGVCR